METRDFETIKENLQWLRSDTYTHKCVEDSVISVTASLATENLSIFTPNEALEYFSDLCGDSFDLSLFAKFCCEIISRNCGELPQTPKLSPSLTVYLRNQMTDKAFNIFSKVHKGLRAIYSHDFKSACEDVYYDRADSCILPLESSSDGLLMPFRNMLIKHELKIAAVTEFTTGDPQVQNTLALVTGGAVDTEGNMLEVHIPTLDQNELMQICNAAKTIDCDVVRITSVESSVSGLYDHHICFTSACNYLSVLKYFLSAKYPAYIILGQYKKSISERNL